jgi:hypothetical protein
MRTLLKWLLGLVLLLGLLLLIAVWGVLGVNPFEGRVKQLWTLVPHDVDFFVRFPGGRLLDQPAVQALESREGYQPLAELKERIRELTEQVATTVNPQVPLGLAKVDLKRDFIESEMAVAGTVAEYQTMRLRNFMAIVRIPYYARFVSALKRDFIRAKIPDAKGIELMRGLYFKMRVPKESVEAMRSFRAVTNRADEEDALFFTRIGDVILVTDSSAWIENSLAGGAGLPADAFFESEFMRKAQGGDRVEVYVHALLSLSAVNTHARPGRPLAALKELVPVKMAGYVRLAAEAKNARLLSFEGVNTPPPDGPSSLRPAQQKLYNAEKADLRYELGPEGIGKFVPRNRTILAAAVKLPAESLVELLPGFLTRDQLDLLDDLVRRRSNSLYVTFERMLAELAADLADTHLVILSRLPIFESADLSTFRDPPNVWPPLPKGQFAVTIVSRVKDSALPDKVREKMTKMLPYLDLEPQGMDGKKRFHRANSVTADREYLFEPCYGALPEGMRFVALSTSPDALGAVYDAALDPGQRLASDESVRAAIAELPSRSTVAFYLRAETWKSYLLDCVRTHAETQLNVPEFQRQYFEGERARGRKEQEITDEEIRTRARDYTDVEYPAIRRRYIDSLAWLDAFDLLSFSLSFGVGPEKKIEATAALSLLD